MKKEARAPVNPIRQRTQYSCMAASLSMCLRANGLDYDEDEVNKVMGARPMQGASWEQAFAAAQHFGQRVTMVIPATLAQVKAWTDRGIPVMIAWNPEGRPWGHASVIFDVTDDGMVHVADPNIPDPHQTVRIVPKDEFYRKWFENYNDYLVRRPALAVEREVSSDGKQRVASFLRHRDRDDREPDHLHQKLKDAEADAIRRMALAAQLLGDARGADALRSIARMIDGQSTRAYGVEMIKSPKLRAWYNDLHRKYNQYTKPGALEALRKSQESKKTVVPSGSKYSPEQMQALQALVTKRPGDGFLKSLLDQAMKGRTLTEAQLKALRQNLYRNNMRDKADLFRAAHLASRWLRASAQ